MLLLLLGFFALLNYFPLSQLPSEKNYFLGKLVSGATHGKLKPTRSRRMFGEGKVALKLIQGHG